VIGSNLSEAEESIEKHIKLGTLNWKSKRCYLGSNFFTQYGHLHAVKLSETKIGKKYIFLSF
jgi:hypothetical protein